MENLLESIRNCVVCEDFLPLGPRPVISIHPDAKVAIIGQAPGTKVHQSGIPWDDLSGKQLRKWMGIDDQIFYDPKTFAIVPMGFCYPGKGKTGDLPPRQECAPLWHDKIWKNIKQLKCTLLIGQYAQRYYLKDRCKRNLTETVSAYHEYLPHYFPLPHPSPRNRFWLAKNEWFEASVIPKLQEVISESIDPTA